MIKSIKKQSPFRQILVSKTEKIGINLRYYLYLRLADDEFCAFTAAGVRIKCGAIKFTSAYAANAEI